jgi:hypothetical protein
MPITIDGSGTITGASTLATTVASPTLTTPNINSAQFATVTGTAPLYAARAWVTFNGTGTVAIRASGNVTSITDNGVGDYTVNFTTAMTDTNYCIAGTATPDTGAGGQGYRWLGTGSTVNSDFSKLTTSARVQVIFDATSKTDSTNVCVAVFR